MSRRERFAKRALTVLGVLASAGTLIAAATGWVIARRLTAPIGPRAFNLTIRAVEDGGEQLKLVLDHTPSTAATGFYNLWFEHGGWVQLGNEIEDRGTDLIARTVTGRSDGLKPNVGDRVSWSGIYYATPADAGLDHQDIVIKTPAGDAPAWRINGDLTTWAIHIHGLGSPRSGTLRGVKVANELGYTSLVVSYRNDGEVPQVGNRRSTLGATEPDDVDEAIGYARRRGAERIVLFGWSMGAAIALKLAHRPEYRELIVGLVLDSPVLNWVNVIKANCKRSGLPAWAGGLAFPWLTRPSLARSAGLPAAIPLGRMNWIERADELVVPTLVLHGPKDDSVPIADARALSQRRPDLVTLEEFSADHTLNWNADREQWVDIVSNWLLRLQDRQVP